MHLSLKGQMLPDSFEDAAKLETQGRLTFRYCGLCGQPLFMQSAASSILGWAETQISGTCEPCFDSMWAEPEDHV